MWGGLFPIRRISIFCCALFSLVVIGFFNDVSVQAFWPFSSGKPQKDYSPGSATATDLNASGEAAADAKKLAAEGKFNEAIARYTEAINRNIGDPVLYFERGSLYFYKMMKAPSEKETTALPAAALVEAQPDANAPPVIESATSASEPCMLALADFNQAISLNPNYGIFFYMRGLVLSATACSGQNPEKAIEDFDRAIKLGPSNAAYYQERANSRAKLKQYGQAINDIDQAILIEPNNYYLFYEKGRIQEQMGMTREASASYKGALELVPPEQMDPFLVALKGARNNNRRVLIADYSDLIGKRPAVTPLYIHRGLLYGDEKNFKSAIDDFSTALSFQKDNGDLYFTRGKLFCEAGKKTDALKDFQASCRLHQPAACYYVRILEKEGNRGEQWVHFWYSRDNRQYFYDRQHLKTQEGSLKVARVRIEADDNGEKNSAGLDKTVSGKEQESYTLEKWEFNCPGSQMRISSVKRIDRDGRAMEPQADFEKAFRPVLPGSIREKLYRIVCSKTENRGTPKKRVILE